MGLLDWNWRLAADLQDVPWDCAACSLAWCLRSIGRSETEADVVAGLGPARITPAGGLVDASGAGLVEYLAELGIASANDDNAIWEEVVGSAGYQPMLIGGRTWNHWVAVRIAWREQPINENAALALMNPSPGWMQVDQVLDPYDFVRLGTFSAVWFQSWT